MLWCVALASTLGLTARPVMRHETRRCLLFRAPVDVHRDDRAIARPRDVGCSSGEQLAIEGAAAKVERRNALNHGAPVLAALTLATSSAPALARCSGWGFRPLLWRKRHRAFPDRIRDILRCSACECSNESPLERVFRGGWSFRGPTASLLRLARSSFVIESVVVHHFAPGRHEVLHELLLRVRDEDGEFRAARCRGRPPFGSDNSIQTGAWSLAPGWLRTVRSTPAA
jgi:hypothetical protein